MPLTVALHRLGNNNSIDRISAKSPGAVDRINMIDWCTGNCLFSPLLTLPKLTTHNQGPIGKQ